MITTIFALALSCSDYEFKNSGIDGEGDSLDPDGNSNGTNDSDSGSDTDWDPPHDDSGGGSDTDTDTGTVEEPPITLDDCIGDASAQFQGAEIAVLSWEPISASGIIISEEQGWFNIYDYSLAESGVSQTNEISYIRISNSRNPHGNPYFTNCFSDWVVDDMDNNGDLGSTQIYIGTFWLEEGENTLELHHYCPYYRAGYCTEFHNNDAANSTCDSSGVNSVHFNGGGLCLRKIDLPEP